MDGSEQMNISQQLHSTQTILPPLPRFAKNLCSVLCKFNLPHELCVTVDRKSHPREFDDNTPQPKKIHHGEIWRRDQSTHAKLKLLANKCLRRDKNINKKHDIAKSTSKACRRSAFAAFAFPPKIDRRASPCASTTKSWWKWRELAREAVCHRRGGAV